MPEPDFDHAARRPSRTRHRARRDAADREPTTGSSPAAEVETPLWVGALALTALAALAGVVPLLVMALLLAWAAAAARTGWSLGDDGASGRHAGGWRPRGPLL